MATIKEIKASLEDVTDLADPRWIDFEADSRSGVQKAIFQRKKAIQAEVAEDKRLETMLRYEREAYNQGFQVLAGIDEVGRGPLAGPVVAAAVILPKGCKIRQLNDSKKIPKCVLRKSVLLALLKPKQEPSPNVLSERSRSYFT